MAFTQAAVTSTNIFAFQFNAGTIAIGASNALGSGTGAYSGNLTWSGGTMASIGTGTYSLSNQQTSITGPVAFSGSGGLSFGGGVAVSSGATVSINGGESVRWGNNSSSAGVLTLAGSGGSLTFASPNTFNAGMSIGSNIAVIVTNGTYANGELGSGTLTMAGGTLTNASGTSVSYSNAVVVTSSMAVSGAAGNGVTFSGSISLNAGAGSNTATINVNDSQGTSLTGVIGDGGSGTGSLIIGGNQDVTVGSANTYKGSTTLSNVNGRFTISTLTNAGVASSLGASSNAAANLVINGAWLRYIGSTDRNFTLGVNGGSIYNDGSGAISFTSTGTIAQAGTGNRTLTLRGANTGTSVMAPVLTDATSGTVSLIKNDAGVWALQGAETYTGSTAVVAGTLLIQGSLSGSSAVSIAAGGTMGVGKAAGAASFGTLNASSLLLSGTNSALKLTMGNTGASDSYTTSGAITISGATFNMILTLDGGVSDLSGTYTLLTWASGSAVLPGQVSLVGSSAQILSDISGGSYALQDVGNSLELVAVPEPSTWALFGCGLAIAGVTWRKKRRKATLV